MMRRTMAAAALTVLAGTFGVGCGSDDKDAAANGEVECPNGGTVRMGVEPFEDAAKLLPAYEPLGAALGEKLGCKVEVIVATSYSAEVEAMRNGELEVGQFGPLGYVLAHEVAGAHAVATWSTDGTTPSTYYASIVAPASKGYTTLDDVKGKSFAYSDPASTSGHLFPAFALEEHGIDPDTGVKPLYAGSHTAVYEALRNGKVDAGELNSEQIDSAIEEGTYKESDFTTLWKSEPIPTSPFVVRGDLPESFKEAFAAAVVALDPSTLPPGVQEVLLGKALVATDDSAYDQIRDLVGILGIELEDLDE